MRKYNLGFVLLSCVVIFLVIFGIGFNRINKRYPQPKVESYNMGETVSYQGCEITVEECEWIQNDEIRNMPIRKDFFSDEEIKAILVKIKVKNVSNEIKTIDSYAFETESLEWNNGVNLGIATAVNEENESLNLNLKSGEEVTRTLAFSMIPQQYTKKQWNEVENRKYNLVLSLYPVKQEINLKFN